MNITKSRFARNCIYNWGSYKKISASGWVSTIKSARIRVKCVVEERR